MGVFERLDEIFNRLLPHTLQRGDRRYPDTQIAAPERFKIPFQGRLLRDRICGFRWRFPGEFRYLKLPGHLALHPGIGFFLVHLLRSIIHIGDCLLKLKRYKLLQRDRRSRRNRRLSEPALDLRPRILHPLALPEQVLKIPGLPGFPVGLLHRFPRAPDSRYLLFRGLRRAFPGLPAAAIVRPSKLFLETFLDGKPLVEFFFVPGGIFLARLVPGRLLLASPDVRDRIPRSLLPCRIH